MPSNRSLVPQRCRQVWDNPVLLDRLRRSTRTRRDLPSQFGGSHFCGFFPRESYSLPSSVAANPHLYKTVARLAFRAWLGLHSTPPMLPDEGRTAADPFVTV